MRDPYADEAISILMEIARDRDAQGMARVQAARYVADRALGSPAPEADRMDERNRVTRFSFSMSEPSDTATIDGEADEVDGDEESS